MMSKQDALALAKQIPFPQPGEILNSVPIEVFCAFMELHGLKPRYWATEYVVLEHDPKKESKS